MAELKLLPPSSNCCQECAHPDHAPDEPHDAYSLYYQVKFFLDNGRYPTWKDAISHCSSKMQKAWEKALREIGRWPDV